MPSRLRIVLALGSAQTLAWGSTYYLPAILAEPMASELGISTGNVFAAFSLALIVTAVLGPLSGKRIDHHGWRFPASFLPLAWPCSAWPMDR